MKTFLKHKCLFLDRDGVINKDNGYVCNIDDFYFCDGVIEALAEFYKAGYMLVVVTNQSGIGRGYYSEEDFKILSDYMLDVFAKNGVKIEKIYHCPHAPEQKCSCRKPSSGMILRAIAELDIDPSKSIIIGDKPSDLAAGAGAGVSRGYLIDGLCYNGVADVLKELKNEGML